MKASGSEVTYTTDAGIAVSCLEHGGAREVFATVSPTASDDPESLFRRLQQQLRQLQAEVLELRIFGAIDAYGPCTRALLEGFGDVDWPVSFIEGGSCLDGTIAGIQMHAVAGASVETVHLDGRAIGRVFEDDHARYCVLGDLRSHAGSKSREAQARDAFANLEDGLRLAGMDLRCVVRTWFFISDILEWYGDFNLVRTEIYRARGLFDRYVPASTGIGGRNPEDAAVVATALAMQPKHDAVTVTDVASPLQCPARDYGSSFSRAAEVSTPDYRAVFVSGTASIDPVGNTLYVGDADAQIARTLEVVGAVLRSRGLGFQDVIRGNAYFKHPRHAAALDEHADRCGLPMPLLVVSQDDVCRDELLFEIEFAAYVVL